MKLPDGAAALLLAEAKKLVRRGRQVNGAMRDYGGGVVPRSGSTETSFTVQS